MNLELNNKHFLITGGSKGIGSKIVENFLKEGSRVTLFARNNHRLKSLSKRLAKNYGEEKVQFFSVDCSSIESLKKLRNKIDPSELYDGIILNVGDGVSVSDPLPSLNQWNKVWSKNFDTALFVCEVFLDKLVKKEGVLLFISSIAGIESIKAPTDYSVAKASINMLAKNLSQKLAPNIRVNVVAPGNICFPGSIWDKKQKKEPRKIKKLINDSVPMRRFGTTSEVADSVVFLCSPRSSFTTGIIFKVDGGQTISL